MHVTATVIESSHPRGTSNRWVHLPDELLARIFCCENGRLFLCGVKTCRRLHQCILQHAPGLPASIRKVALERFEAVGSSGGFKRMNEGMLCDLVRDDSLAADEEEVLKAVSAWIKEGGGEEGRGERLLREVRFGLLGASRLAELAEIPGTYQGASLRDLVAEAQSPLGEHFNLCDKAFVRRKGMDVAWGEYAEGRRQHRPVRGKQDVLSLCGSEGRVYGGLSDGIVMEWEQSTLQERQRLRCEGQVGLVVCMAACGGLVISGHGQGDYCVRVWNAATGSCDHVLRGHTSSVRCVATWEEYLVSGSWDTTVKVWGMRGAVPWPCLGTITVHTDAVNAIIVWEGRVISGSLDKKIHVCDIVTRQHEATLDAHIQWLQALVVCGRTLLSTGDDVTIGVWVVGTWDFVRRLRVSEHVPDALWCYCLAVSGSTLLCGGARKDGTSGFVVVFDAETKRYQHTLCLDHYVYRLLSVRGEVWGRLGDKNVVVWGKAEPGEGSGTKGY